MLPRIPVDGNNRDQYGRFSIFTNHYPELVNILRPGLRVILFEEGDYEIEANIEFDEEHGWWWGVADFSTIKYLDEPNATYE